MKGTSYLAVSLSIFVLAGTAQATENEGWTSFTANYKPTKMFNFSLKEELRMKDDLQTVDKYFTQLYLGIRPFKRFELGAGFRFIRDHDTKGKIQGYENHIRLHLDLKYRFKFRRLRLTTRLRYQNRNELDVPEIEYGKQRVRMKLSATYNIRKWKFDPIFAWELFYALKDYDPQEFDKGRITLGTEYKIRGFGRIGLFYRLEYPLNSNEDPKTNIFMLTYAITFR